MAPWNRSELSPASTWSTQKSYDLERLRTFPDSTSNSASFSHPHAQYEQVGRAADGVSYQHANVPYDQHGNSSNDSQTNISNDTKGPIYEVKAQSIPRKQLNPRTHKRFRWMPGLVLVFAFSILLWIALFYAIFLIKSYPNHESGYWRDIILVMVIPSAVLAIFVVCVAWVPHLRQMSSRFMARLIRVRRSGRYLPLINILNAICCVVLTMVYLFLVALPQYRKIHWENSVENRFNLPTPSFALIDLYNYTGGVQNPLVNFTCGRAHSNGDADSNSCASAVSIGRQDDYTAFVFNASNLPDELQEVAWQDGGFGVLFNISYSAAAFNNVSDSSKIILGQRSLFFTMFDKRMTIDQASSCNFINLRPVNAAGFYLIATTLTEVTDAYGLILGDDTSDTSDTSSVCSPSMRPFYTDSDNPLQSFGYTTVSSTSYVNRCIPTPGTDGAEILCPFFITFYIDSQMVTVSESAPGISRIDILLNAGAVVGGVQFFFWFLTMFA